MIGSSRPTAPRSASASPDARHAVYLDMLERLSLSADHDDDLIGRRGLSEETVMKNLYATAPDASALAAVAGAVADAHVCVAVPGFWRDGAAWRISARPGDLLIPVRDINRLIVGVVLRSDEPGRRYRWLSSAGRRDGSAASAAIHYALRRSASEIRTAIVTEGVLKADAILERLDDVDVVVGLPGVAIAARAAEEIVRALPNLRRVLIAFDADYRTNDAVARAVRAIVSEFIAARVTTEVITWNPIDGKGLDDVLRGLHR